MHTPLYKNEYITHVIPLIQNAGHSINICTYDWRWYPENPEHDIQQLNMNLVAAVARNVKVKALVQDRSIVSLLKSHGIAAKQLVNAPTLHAKIMIVDNEIVVFGSHNLTHRAMSHNIELSCMTDTPAIVNQLGTIFNNLYGL